MTENPSEVQRLRQRTRELAERNVSLMREVSNLNKRDKENKIKMAYFEQQLEELTTRLEDMKDENQDLRKTLSELQDKYTAAEEGRIYIQKNFEDKEKECKELYKSVTRSPGTCSEQEKTIDDLRQGFGKELERNQPLEKVDKCVRVDDNEKSADLKKQRSVSEQSEGSSSNFSRRSLDNELASGTRTPRWLGDYLDQLGSVLRQGGWSESDISEML